MKKILVYIYRHFNPITGFSYIGQTVNPNDRFSKNGKNYKTASKFYLAIQEYGWDSFTHEIIDTAENEIDANYLESYYIRKFNSIKKGYNITEGGDIYRNHFQYTPEMENKDNVRILYKTMRKSIPTVASYRNIREALNDKNLKGKCLGVYQCEFKDKLTDKNIELAIKFLNKKI